MTRTPLDDLSRRQLLRRAVVATGAMFLSHGGTAPAARADESPRPGPDPDFRKAIRPTPRTARFILDDFYVWCGAPARSDDGVYHLLYSRWPRRLGHYAWVTHSEVAHATADSPLGPFKHQGIALKGAGGDAWDAHCIHNPTVLRVGKKFYLYYMGNRGTGDYAAGPKADEAEKVKIDARWWSHRNNQRVGVAVADDPGGPWERVGPGGGKPDRPLIDVDPTPGSWDHLIASNPSACPMPDGRFLMMYKTVADGPPPGGGKVQHAVATADGPTGPFKRHPDPVLTHPTAKFPAEDPFIWHDPGAGGKGGKFRAIVKDNAGYFTGAGYSLALFESADGLKWGPSAHVMVSKPTVRWADGEVQTFLRMERPQLLLDAGVPRALYVACDWDKDRSHSCNIALPLEWGEGV